jgi:hypothetical protein
MVSQVVYFLLISSSDNNEITIVKLGGVRLLLDSYLLHKDVEVVAEHFCGTFL